MPLTRNKTNIRGYTMIEVMILVNIIGILMIIAIPNLIRAREQARAKSCSKSLKAIDSAKQQWAMDNKINSTSTVSPTLDTSATTGLIGPTLYLKSTPVCPSGGAYTVNPINTDPTCSSNNPPTFVHSVNGS